MFDIPINSAIAMGAVLGLLIVATCTRLILAARSPEKDFTELRQRIQSWWWIVGSLFIVLALNSGAVVAFFALLSFLALREFLSVVSTREADRRVIVWAFLAIPIQYFLDILSQK